MLIVSVFTCDCCLWLFWLVLWFVSVDFICFAWVLVVIWWVWLVFCFACCFFVDVCLCLLIEFVVLFACYLIDLITVWGGLLVFTGLFGFGWVFIGVGLVCYVWFMFCLVLCCVVFDLCDCGVVLVCLTDALFWSVLVSFVGVGWLCVALFAWVWFVVVWVCDWCCT